MKILHVAAVALVDSDGRILLAQRPEGKPLAGLWEFPGGKIEAGETPEHCLIRELKEELAIDVEKACLAPFTFTSFDYPEFHLVLLLYICRKWKGSIIAQENQALVWKKPNELSQLPMPPADEPLAAMLRDYL